jgi:site-specific recombinase XerD
MSSSRQRRPLDSLLEGYLAYVADVGRRSHRTVIDIRCTLKRVSQRLATHGDQPLWKRPLTDYLWWQEEERQGGAKSSSLQKLLSHLRGFLDYAWRSGRADRNVLDGFQLPASRALVAPAALTLAEAECLLRSCPTGSAAERRDRLVILLLYGCGLRTHELCALQLANVDSV